MCIACIFIAAPTPFISDLNYDPYADKVLPRTNEQNEEKTESLGNQS